MVRGKLGQNIARRSLYVHKMRNGMAPSHPGNFMLKKYIDFC